MTDISSAEPGDTAIVALKVIEKVYGECLRVALPNTDYIFTAREIRSIEKAPKPLTVGDKVRFKKRDGRISGVILALSGDSAWVKWETYPWPHTCALNELERAPIEAEG